MIKTFVTEPGKSITDHLMSQDDTIQLKEAKKLLRSGLIRLNGMIVKKDGELSEGDCVEIDSEEFFEALRPKTTIEYEDDNFLIYNKQPGVRCSSEKFNRETLMHMAEEHMREQGSYLPSVQSVPLLCFTIDEQEGGLVIIAKNEETYNETMLALRQRRIRKFYQCYIVGALRAENEEFHNFLIHDKHIMRAKIVDTLTKDSLPIVTRCRALQSNDRVSLVEVEPVTCRKYQIRSQLAYNGFPILGDPVYGNGSVNRKFRLHVEAIWHYKLVFEVGKNNLLEYLNKKVIETQAVNLPYMSF